ncbi:NUMOD3 domain-containing DNA-binding protein [Cupriavidus necator]
MKPTHIYALIDPRTGFVRYVGKTVMSIEHRLAVHVSNARKTHTHSARWICGLLSAGLRPEAIHIETVMSDWQEAECYWIAQFRFLGFDLANHTAGGDGLNSHQHSEESKARMSEAMRRRYVDKVNPLKGRKRPQEVLEKMSIALRGKKFSDERRAMMREVSKRIQISPETRAKMAATMRGKPKPPRSAEHSAKIAERARGRVRSEEAKAKTSAALKGRTLSEEHRRKLSEAAKRRFAATRGQDPEASNQQDFEAVA